MTSMPSKHRRRRPGVLKYHHLIRPTAIAGQFIALDTVAATLWRHFGFPANLQKQVLSKQCVVCTACKRVLRYQCGEDANLRAHLRHAHRGLYRDLLEAESKRDADGLATVQPTATDVIQPMIIKCQRLHSDAEDQPDTTTVAQPMLTAEDLLRCTAEMCAVDLRELDFCDNPGFAELVMSLSGLESCPGSRAVRAELLRMRADIHRRAGVASRLQPFSLGLEKWFNADGQRFFTLSMLTDGGGGDNGPIRRQSLCTWMSTATRPPLGDPWRRALNALDMQQCRAFVENYVRFDDVRIVEGICGRAVHLPSFVANRKVQCLASVIDTIGQRVLCESAVGNSFEQTTDLRWLDDLFGGGDATPAAETNGGGRPREPHVLACLQTLHTALETVRLESGATAALNWPLCQQLVKKHFGDCAEDDIRMCSVKRLVCRCFEELLAQQSLSTFTFLDPRFQSLVSADRDLLKSTIQDLRVMCSQSGSPGSGKAGLAFLFGDQNKIPLTTLDAELQRYAAVEALALDGCPRQWWSQQASAMPLLAAAARQTFCVPAVLPLPMPSTLERRRGISANMAPTDLDVLMTVNESLAARTE